MSFKGYVVYGYSLNEKSTFTERYYTKKAVVEMGFDDEFPDAQEFAFGTYLVFGDPVEKVTDKAGNLLWANDADYLRRMNIINTIPA